MLLEFIRTALQNETKCIGGVQLLEILLTARKSKTNTTTRVQVKFLQRALKYETKNIDRSGRVYLVA